MMIHSNTKSADIVSPTHHFDMFKSPIWNHLSNIPVEFDKTRSAFPWNSTQTYLRGTVEHVSCFITLWLKHSDEVVIQG